MARFECSGGAPTQSETRRCMQPILTCMVYTPDAAETESYPARFSLRVTKYVCELYAKISTHVYGLETVSLRFSMSSVRARTQHRHNSGGSPSFSSPRLLAGQSPRSLAMASNRAHFTLSTTFVEAHLLPAPRLPPPVSFHGANR